MKPLDELALLLRPAAGGLHLVSTGRAAQLSLQRRLYQVDDDAQVQDRFRECLGQIAGAKGVLLGVPSDVGAGLLRGSNLGPQEIRARLLEERPGWPDEAKALRLVDIGDVFVVPQLLHDEMLSDAQLSRSRKALYPGVVEPLPVSPLSITKRALDLVFALNPAVKPFVLGGDHSIALPVARALAKVRKAPWGIVQPDAHTDLLEERLGVRECFATWSYHANELLGRQGRLVQVGVRASGKPKEHWENTYGVRQFWAEEVRRDPAAALEGILAHVKGSGVTTVYFSNDIDGTDERFADATGTPEQGGLEPDFVVELIRRLGAEVSLCGGDVMEVAPSIQRTPDGARRTVGLAVRYLLETLKAGLG
jgi:arginase family enzyme